MAKYQCKKCGSLEHVAGVRHFEVGSFLPTAKVSSIADIEVLVDTLSKLDGAHSAALSLNERGVADALKTSVDEIVCVIS